MDLACLGGMLANIFNTIQGHYKFLESLVTIRGHCGW